jgi:hypothetical protein
MEVKTPCYTTKTGIRIGCAYQPPLRALSYEEARMQSILLGNRPKSLSVKAVALICLTLFIAIIWIAKP